MTKINQNITQVFNEELFTERRRFTFSEDVLLMNLINKIGSHNWNEVAKYIPGRTGKQCRDRFCNYLNEPHTILPWSKEEDELLLNLMKIVGTKWSTISKYMPKRSGNDAKNRWYKHLSKNYSYIIREKDEMKLVNEKRIENSNNNNHCDETDEKYSVPSLLIH